MNFFSPHKVNPLRKIAFALKKVGSNGRRAGRTGKLIMKWKRLWQKNYARKTKSDKQGISRSGAWLLLLVGISSSLTQRNIKRDFAIPCCRDPRSCGQDQIGRFWASTFSRTVIKSKKRSVFSDEGLIIPDLRLKWYARYSHVKNQVCTAEVCW